MNAESRLIAEVNLFAGQGLLFLALTDLESHQGFIEEVWAAVDEADADLDHFHVASSLLGVHHCWDSAVQVLVL